MTNHQDANQSESINWVFIDKVQSGKNYICTGFNGTEKKNIMFHDESRLAQSPPYCILRTFASLKNNTTAAPLLFAIWAKENNGNSRTQIGSKNRRKKMPRERERQHSRLNVEYASRFYLCSCHSEYVKAFGIFVMSTYLFIITGCLQLLMLYFFMCLLAYGNSFAQCTHST